MAFVIFFCLVVLVDSRSAFMSFFSLFFEAKGQITKTKILDKCASMSNMFFCSPGLWSLLHKASGRAPQGPSVDQKRSDVFARKS